MKNFNPILALCLAIFSLSSCSQNQKLVQENDHEYRYKKVYVGNKIIYRDAHESTTLDLNNPSLIAIEEEQEVITPLETYTDNTLPEASLTAENSVKPSFSFEYYANALAKRKFLKSESKKIEEDPGENSDGTLGLLGFIFSLVGLILLASFVALPALALFGLAFLIAGFVLSIIGITGPKRGWAIAGLIISILGFVLVLLLMFYALVFLLFAW